MTVTIAVAGVKGAGGVTATALTIAAVNGAGGAPTLLVEADPSGGSLLAWCEQLRHGLDLYDVTASRDPQIWEAATQQLGDISVLPGRGTPFRFEQALVRPRAGWHNLFGQFDGAVVIDVGRIYPSAPSMNLLSEVDVVVLVAASETGPVAATMEWANRAGRHGANDIGVSVERLRMVTVEVVGRRPAMSVKPKDLSMMTGAGYLGHLPHDVAALDMLCRGYSVEAHKQLRRSALVRAARDLPALLSDPTRVGVLS